MPVASRASGRVIAYLAAALFIGIVWPIVRRMHRRGTAYAKSTARDVTSPWRTALRDFIGLDEFGHEPEPRNIYADEIIRALIGAAGARPRQ